MSHLDVNEQQQREIDGLREKNQTLRDCLKATGKRMILTNAQRKNLSIKAAALGARLEDVLSIVRPAPLAGLAPPEMNLAFNHEKHEPARKKSLEVALTALP